MFELQDSGVVKRLEESSEPFADVFRWLQENHPKEVDKLLSDVRKGQSDEFVDEFLQVILSERPHDLGIVLAFLFDLFKEFESEDEDELVEIIHTVFFAKMLSNLRVLKQDLKNNGYLRIPEPDGFEAEMPEAEQKQRFIDLLLFCYDSLSYEDRPLTPEACGQLDSKLSELSQLFHNEKHPSYLWVGNTVWDIAELYDSEKILKYGKENGYC